MDVKFGPFPCMWSLHIVHVCGDKSLYTYMKSEPFSCICSLGPELHVEVGATSFETTWSLGHRNVCVPITNEESRLLEGTLSLDW